MTPEIGEIEALAAEHGLSHSGAAVLAAVAAEWGTNPRAALHHVLMKEAAGRAGVSEQKGDSAAALKWRELTAACVAEAESRP